MTRRLIILNDFAEAERILSSGFRNGLTYSEILTLAKYYHFLKYKPKQIRQSIIDFCVSQDEFFNLDTYSKMISSVLNKAKIYKMKSASGVNIPVYGEEIDKIKHLPHKLYKLLFVMLVMARYQKFQMSKIKEIKRKKFTFYLNNLAFEDVCRMSGMSISDISQNKINKLKYELDGVGGFISANLFSEKSWEIKFAVNEGKVVGLVRDLEHIEKFVVYYCTKCGVQFEKKGRREICGDCHVEYRKKLVRESMRKSRTSV